ncbi:E3 ubiquitin-protein ligase RNF34-like isoform X2 [Littorina saxatilis]|uniref:RING-type domain-containing protein n=1 Tax=Littorina saxatilis TaxID=31220 RepID=A0AAN9AL24_9CAEN
MGAGAVSGHSTSTSRAVSGHSTSTSRANQIFPTPAPTPSVAPGNPTSQPLTPAPWQQVSSSSPQPHTSTALVQSSPGVGRAMPNKVMSCETCDNTFTFFKRKKLCKDCHRSFCSSCLPKPPSNQRQTGRQCGKCVILTSGRFTRQQLQAWRVKDMRCFLDARNIPTETCKEKHDLIDLVLLHFCLESNSVLREQREHDRLVGELADRMRNSSFYATPTLPNHVSRSQDPSPVRDLDPQVTLSHDSPASQSRTSVPQASQSQEGDDEGEEGEATTNIPDIEERDNSEVFLSNHLRERQTREMREAMRILQEELDQEQPETRPGIVRANIDDLETADSAENMTVRQLKEILVNNFVDYHGCCEKHELVERVKRLWVETQANRQRAADILYDSTPTQTTDPASTEEGQKGQGRDPEHDVCKICMDAAIDCILLECGHMITCTKCGKRLADCPICRQYITRVVHVFRS